MLAARTPRASTPVTVRLVSVPVVAVVLLVGGWVAGGVITNDFQISMALTAVWVGFVGLVCLVLFFWRRDMWPALATFVVMATVAGAYLGSQTLIDDRVDENVVRAAPAAAAPAGQKTLRPANVLLARGRFESLEHSSRGVAQIIEVRGNRRVLTLTRFETDNGPDLRVYITTADANQDSAGDYVDLGGLKGNIGNQQYDIPADADLDRRTKVIIWCRAFSVGFGAAPLRSA